MCGRYPWTCSPGGGRLSSLLQPSQPQLPPLPLLGWGLTDPPLHFGGGRGGFAPACGSAAQGWHSWAQQPWLSHAPEPRTPWPPPGELVSPQVLSQGSGQELQHVEQLTEGTYLANEEVNGAALGFCNPSVSPVCARRAGPGWLTPHSWQLSTSCSRSGRCFLLGSARDTSPRCSDSGCDLPWAA